MPARGEASCNSSMIEAAKCARVSARLPVWRRKSMLTTSESPRSSAMKSAGSVKPASSMESAAAIDIVAIDENSAVRDVGVVVVNNSVVMPVVSPVVPTPAIPPKEADSKAEAKCNARTGNIESRIRIPARPDPDRLSIHEPGVIFRNVNDLRFGWFDHNGFPLLAHLFLRCTL